MSGATLQTGYEQNQDFNKITRFLHSGRYAALLRITKELSRTITDRPIKALEVGCGPGTAVGPLLEHFHNGPRYPAAWK